MGELETVEKLLGEVLAQLQEMNRKLDDGLSLANNPLVRGAAKAKSGLERFKGGLPT